MDENDNHLMKSAGEKSTQKGKTTKGNSLMPIFAKAANNSEGHNVLIFILRNSRLARDNSAKSIISIAVLLFGANP